MKEKDIYIIDKNKGTNFIICNNSKELTEQIKSGSDPGKRQVIQIKVIFQEIMEEKCEWCGGILMGDYGNNTCLYCGKETDFK